MANGMKLSETEQVGYACGMLGWSVLTNIVAAMLIYFYVPPNNAGMAVLAPAVRVFGLVSLLSLVVASGRLLDAVTDPLVAHWSDRSRHPGGRRLPFMRVAVAPSVLFGVLIFLPPAGGESHDNFWWLFFMQGGFYLALTIYVIPYTALLPELAATARAKVRLSAWLSLAFVLGLILSSQTPAFADWFQEFFRITDRRRAFQLAIGALALLAGLFMSVPLLTLDERRLTTGEPASVPLREALSQTLGNRNFRIFILADFTYFVCLTTIASGMLYFVSVLLPLREAVGGQVMGTLVLVSLVFYPLVIRLADRAGKRRPLIASFLFLGLLLCGLFFLGKLPLPPRLQIFGFAVLVAAPVAFLGILPYAVIAELAETDGRRTGQQKEALFFAVRNFSTKLGQTVGVMAFAILLLFGKDPGNDWGIRLAILFSGGLALAAGLIFTGFREPHPPAPEGGTKIKESDDPRRTRDSIPSSDGIPEIPRPPQA